MLALREPVRPALLALCAVVNIALCFAWETWTENDFLLMSPQPPYKFIDLPEPFATTGIVQALNSVVDTYPAPAHVLDMGVHPPFFMVGQLPGHPQFTDSKKAEEKWRALEASDSTTITSRLCLLPASGPNEPLPVTLHEGHSSLFYVETSAAENHIGDASGFDFLSRDLLCFAESVWVANLRGMRSSCRQRPGVTPPHTCYSIISLPSEFMLKFDENTQNGDTFLRSRVLYKAVVELSLTIAFPHGEPIVIELLSPVFFTAFRQKINFAYLVQAEGPFATSHLETDHSLALVAQWRQNATQPNSFYMPNSTVNEGRNELYRRVQWLYPGVAFLYFIFMDEDLELLIRATASYPSAEFVPEYNSSTQVALNDPMAYRLFERYLLDYLPAIGVPWHRSWACGDQDEVQLVNHFDHIIVAVHADFARFILPTETRFDNMCWWFGQQTWALTARLFAHQHRLQFNAVESRNAGSRSENVEGAVTYHKRHDFYHMITWFMSSVRNNTLLEAIQLDVDPKKWFWYGGMLGQINTQIGSQNVLVGSVRGYPPNIIHPDNIDCCHPYWQTHRLEVVTPNAAWGSALPWRAGLQLLNCSMTQHPSLQCSSAYAPDSQTHFRLFWLNQRMLQVMQRKMNAQEQRLLALEQAVAKLTSETRQCNGSGT